jgi:hypothetical protein
MKPIESSAHRLTLKSRPWLAWVGGAIGAGLGLTLMASAKPTTQVACDRPQGYCQIQVQGRERRVPIADLQKAQMEARPGQRGRDIYGVVLHSQTETLKIEYLENAGAIEQERIVRLVNGFLKDRKTDYLTLEQGIHPGIYAIGALLIMLGGLMAVAGRTTQVSFDRPSGLVRITRHCLGKNEVYTCSLQEVIDVELERALQRPSSPQIIQKEDYGLPPERGAGDYYVYRISLRLANGQYLPLTDKFTPDLHGGRDIAMLVGKIQQFLKGIPLLGEAYGVKMN